MQNYAIIRYQICYGWECNELINSIGSGILYSSSWCPSSCS